MQVFKTFMKIAKKKLPIVLMYAWIFIVLLIMFTAYGPQDVSFEDKSLGVSVIDEDNTDASRAVTEFISKSHKLIELENDKDVIIDALYYTRADYVLVIKEGYSAYSEVEMKELCSFIKALNINCALRGIDG